jgi:NAD kinase
MFNKILIVHKDNLPEESKKYLGKIINLLKGRNFKILSYSEFNKNHADKFDLVITFGGDGTFVKVGNLIKDSFILGINSNPNFSEGALTNFCIKSIDALNEILEGKFSIFKRTRAKIVLNGKEIDEKAINEVYIGSLSQFHSSRYKIKFNGKEEEQRSSGIIVSTGTGSTGWYKSAGGKPFNPEEEKLSFIVREPYIGNRLFKPKILSGDISKEERIIVESLRDFGGVLAINDSIFDFNKGDIVEIELSNQPLNVLIKNSQE